MLELIKLVLPWGVYIAGVLWLIHSIPGKWKSTVSLIITLLTIGFQDPIRIKIFDYHYENKVFIDSLRVSESRIMESMKAEHARLIASQEELKRLLFSRLDTLAVHRDSLSAKIDSVDGHMTRHFNLTNPKLKEIREILKKE